MKLAKLTLVIATTMLISCVNTLSANFISNESTDTIRIVTWNARELFSVTDVQNRESDFKAFYRDIQPDVILVQEVTALNTLKEMQKAMGLEHYDVGISEFVKDGTRHADFEVGYISRYPIEYHIEYDPKPDSKPANEESLYALENEGIVPVGTTKGYMTAKVKGMKFYISVVHLKSSRGAIGKRDSSNAQKREFVIAHLANEISKEVESNKNATFLVAGDFNVGHSDEKKNGISLDEDCYVNCSDKDLYDETHAILSAGIIQNLKMTNLCKDIVQSTCPRYSGTPIDNIYVYGRERDGFMMAVRVDNTYGSDHVPVYTDFVVALDANVVTPYEAPVISVPVITSGDGIEIFALLPNPEGDESVNETATIINGSSSSVDLTGWILKDKANTIWKLDELGTLSPNQKETIHRNNQQMGMNNSGDVIRLIDNDGNEIDRVKYGSTSSGQQIYFN